jgi:hypothetical protein
MDFTRQLWGRKGGKTPLVSQVFLQTVPRLWHNQWQVQRQAQLKSRK